ncbi:MAG: sugar transferase [Opitutaceae bacterium]
MSRGKPNQLRQVILPLISAAGDSVASFTGIAAGYFLRFHTPLGSLGIQVPNATFQLYLPLMAVGVALLMASFAYLDLYDSRLLLRKYRSLALLFKGTTFWLFAYLGVSLALKFDPPISRLFVALSYLTILAALFAWRSAFFSVLTRTRLRDQIQRRVAILGCNDRAVDLVEEISRDTVHPFTVVGTVTEPEISEAFPTAVPGIPILGSVDDLPRILRQHRIDIVLAVRLDRAEGETLRLMEVCERHYVEWKVVPDAFEIFVSNLRLQTVGRTPVLGIEEFAVTRLSGRILKRMMDLAGASIGLVVSAPIMACLAWLIRRESKGPVFFHQERVGAHHRKFQICKLRSMQVDAEKADNQIQSTLSEDQRLLRIGRFMRRWNLDELPQFWNVLKGEMSLVGPRPERPYHVDRLAEEIPHYMPRHLVKPGITGWAQVHGLRGETDLTQRIQYDITYIENWTPILDLQILMMTFLRWRDDSFTANTAKAASPVDTPTVLPAVGRPASRHQKRGHISALQADSFVD